MKKEAFDKKFSKEKTGKNRQKLASRPLRPGFSRVVRLCTARQLAQRRVGAGGEEREGVGRREAGEGGL